MIKGFYVNRDSGLFCSDGAWERPSGVSTALDWLLSHQGDINVLSDLDSDVAALLGMMQTPRAVLEALVEDEVAQIGAYTLKYFPDRFFAVEKSDGGNTGRVRFANFADASRYKYSLRQVRNDRSKGYGERRAKDAAEVGEEVYRTLEGLGLKPTSLVSPASVFRKHHYDTGEIELPSLEKIPDKAMIIARECCKGNWVQTFKRGHFERVQDYDLNSAYSGQAMRLLDLDGGSWVEGSEYQSRATYGYCRCIVTITGEPKFHPIIFKPHTELYTPRGSFPESLTKREIDYIRAWDIGEVQILDGIWWFDDFNPNDGTGSYQRSLLAGTIHSLYKEKEKAEGIAREVIKQLMSGAFYGVFIEENVKGLGEYYCSPWAAEIEVGTRLEVGSKCISSGVVPIAVAVDGVVTDGQLLIGGGGRGGKGIGEWRLSHAGKCLSIGTGLVAMETKEGEGDFSLTYDRAMEMIQGNPEADEWTMEKLGIVKAAKAVQEKRWGEVGKIETMTRTIDLSETKMDYDEYPQSGRELLENTYKGELWSADMLMELEGE